MFLILFTYLHTCIYLSLFICLPMYICPCTIWGFHGGGYEECRLLDCKNSLRTSQETHYVSVTESSRLMLCKTWGFHGGDYEECCLLGYKNPVRTLQKTHNVSAIEPSRWMLCKIWGFHCNDYEECRLMGCDAVLLLYEAAIRKNVLPPSWAIGISDLGAKSALTSNWSTLRMKTIFQLLITTNFVHDTLILYSLTMDAISYSET
jgi:hypothetical protein